MRKIFKQKKSIVFFLIAFFSVGTVSAQITVSGKLTDTKGAPLIAASVAELGTTNGTFTELDGTWTLSVKSADSQLEFSYVGYATQVKKVGSQRTFNVSLKPDAVQMETVVKIGYAAVKLEDATGSPAVLAGEELTKAPVLAVDQALQGKAPGVSVTSNSGTPGAAMDIVIRGRGTTGDARPLYVVDGVPQGYEYRGDPGNIESLTILKDASSCAIYGARGANGVVLITTKGGNQVEDYEYVNINFDGYKGVQQAWKKMDVLTGDQFVEKMGTYPTGYDNGNAFWQDTVFRVATIQKYRLSADGGSARSSWSISAGYQDQDGIVRTTNYTRYDFGTKAMYKVNKRLDIGANIGYSQNSQRKVNEAGIEQSPLGLALIFDPTVKGGLSPASAYSGQSFGNPEVELKYKNDTKTGYGVGAGAWMNYKLDFLLDGLEFKSQFNYGKWGNEEKVYQPVYFVSTTQNNGVSYIENTVQGGYNWSLSNTLTYAFKLYNADSSLVNHSFRFLLGHEVLYDFQDTYMTRVENVGKEDFQHYVISGESADKGVWSETWQAPNEHSMLSYIGRMEYSFRDKYLMNFTVRRDGSSRFGSQYKYGYFPSLGLAWKINKEPFFYNNEFLKKNINLCKFRVGWGKIGNENIGNYLFVASMVADQESGYNFGGKTVNGVVVDGVANDELHWEEATSWDFGTDISFWDNKLMFNFDYFIKNNVDNLVKLQVPAVVGCDKKNPTVNAGKILNRGYEVGLVYRNNKDFGAEGNKHKLTYSVGGNLSHTYNEVTELGGTTLYGGNIGRSSDVYACRTLEGYPIASFWGYKVDGVFSSYEEINNSSQSNAKLGDYKLVDVDGDGKITTNDITCIGNPNPDFTYGFNFDASFYGFDFSMSFQGVAGNEIFNNTKYYLDGGAGSLGSNLSTRRLDVWSRDNTSSTEPTKGEWFTGTYYPNSAYVENGSYFRLKNVTLGYTVPENIVEKIKLRTLRVYVQGQNLLTFTKYQGFDPEIGINQAMNWEGPELGVDRGSYPQARSVVFGVNLGF